MSDLKSFAFRVKSKNAELRSVILKQFGRDEDGGILVLTLLLFIMMLVMGGMAVDFMRYESRRAALQSVADRAVLAAANLDQNAEATVVLNEYFQKAGFDGSIVGTPKVVTQGGSRSVSVDAQLDLNTFYLRFIGIDQLQAPASSSAIEGSGDVEISLVLDISGSMRGYVSGTGKTRIQLVREAATDFVEDLLVPEYEDQISISLVTYSSQVAVDEELFAAINVNRTDVVDLTISPSDPRVYDLSKTPEENGPDANPLLQLVEKDGIDQVTFLNPATCIDFPTSEYTKTAFAASLTYNQVPTFQRRTFRSGHSNENDDVAVSDQPDCPNSDFEKIIPISQDRAALTYAIGKMEPRQFTSIYLGMKWGATLLDPSMRNIIATLPSTDETFRGHRPSDYVSSSNNVSTQKYLILMTDGNNQSGTRVRWSHYDTVAEQLRWFEQNFVYANKDGNRGSWPWLNQWSVVESNWSEATGDARLQEICKATRAQGITIFAIAMGAPTNGEEEMKECATATPGTTETDGYYFENDGGEIDLIFENIAKQITALRLQL